VAERGLSGGFPQGVEELAGEWTPRDPAAWLIFVGRNSALDEMRAGTKHDTLPDDDVIPDAEHNEAALVERLDSSAYHDDVLRLLFVCCQPDLPATQQIAVALRIVSGLSVQEIARAFLVSEAAMAQRITRAKRAMAESPVACERQDRSNAPKTLTTVAAMIYLPSRGIFGSGGEAHVRVPL